MQTNKDKPFFVGYLDMPSQLKKFYWPLGMVMMLISLFMGYTLASAQKSSATASWDTSQTETIQGLIQVAPYPVLHTVDPQNPEETQSILLVQQGKYSADAAALPFHNQFVTVKGFPIRHGGWTMLEITGESDIQLMTESDASNLATFSEEVKPTSLGSVSLSGEIIDSKCYLGVMKPGEGPVHRACAEVCLLGGMPPMLVVRGHDNLRYGYILANADGSSVSTDLADSAGHLRQVKGELIRMGDLLYIQLQDGASKISLNRLIRLNQGEEQLDFKVSG